MSKSKTIIVGMSGGVDSSVAALLLIVPGFFTDLLGFLLLIPFTRKILFSMALKNKKEEENKPQSKTIDG